MEFEPVFSLEKDENNKDIWIRNLATLKKIKKINSQ